MAIRKQRLKVRVKMKARDQLLLRKSAPAIMRVPWREPVN